MKIKVSNAIIKQDKDKDSLDFSIEIQNTEEERKAFELVPVPDEIKKAMEMKKVISGFDVNDFITYIEAYHDSRQAVIK